MYSPCRRTWLGLLVLFVAFGCGRKFGEAHVPGPRDVAASLPVAGPTIVTVATPLSPELDASDPSGDSNSTKKTETIAEIIDQALIKEFDKEEKQHESEVGQDFNKTQKMDEARLETVVRISSKTDSDEKEDAAATGTDGSGADGPATAGSKNADGTTADSDEPEEAPSTDLPKLDRRVDRIIDSQDNEFVLSKPKETLAALTLDPQLVQDITFLIIAAAAMGMVFEYMKQPVINGYLVAGALVGPGGFQLIKELVQVESVAQIGVELLLFGLGLELSMSKLRAVWGAAIIGGLIQILMMVVAMGALAALMGASVGQGIFVGAVISMSSTSVVVKCLETMKATNSSYGQIVIGTLLLQDCCVGLMFALMPVLTLSTTGLPSGDADRNAVVVVMVIKLLIKLVITLFTAAVLAYTVVPPILRTITRTLSKELVQLTLVAICVGSAWLMGELGLSEELGAFVSGAMLAGSRAAADMPDRQAGSPTHRGTAGAATDTVQSALHSIGSLQNVMAALFVASIGMVMSPVFLAHHISVLAVGTMVVIIGKAMLVGGVVHFFGVPGNTSLAVGISMAHIGEFGLVLLSIASQHRLLSNHVYMLLLGVTALSLLTTPMVIMVCHRLVRAEPRTLPRVKPPSDHDVAETGPLSAQGSQPMPIASQRMSSRRGGVHEMAS